MTEVGTARPRLSNGTTSGKRSDDACRLSETRTAVIADIGGTWIKLGAVSDGMPLDGAARVPTATLDSGEPVSTIARLLADWEREHRIVADAYLVTIPGFIASDGDSVLMTANVPALEGRQVATELRAALEKPVFLERDATLLTIGETIGQDLAKASCILGVFIGTGIGACVLVDGRPFRGAGWALEIGHIPVQGNGRKPSWARSDVLDAYASGRALADFAQRQGQPVEKIFRAGQQDQETDLWLESFVRFQVDALAASATLFCPDVLIVGGGVTEIEGFPREAVARAVHQRVPRPDPDSPLDIRWARLGWQAALIGASRFFGVDRH